MALFWNSNGKKARTDLKNLYTDKRCSPTKSKLSGDSQYWNILANLFNSKK